MAKGWMWTCGVADNEEDDEVMFEVKKDGSSTTQEFLSMLGSQTHVSSC